MRKIVAFSLPGLILTACADAPEKYRDIKHLELPPTLAIEHVASAPVKSYGSSSSTTTLASDGSSKKSDDLDKLIYIIGEDQHPVIQLKTRFDRAWDLTDHGLTLAEVEIIEKDKEKGIFKVRFEDKAANHSLMQSVSSMFSISYEDIEYTLTLDKDSRTTGVHIDKIKVDDANSNSAQKLATLLVETIKKDLSK